jgi:hypothetical protein
MMSMAKRLLVVTGQWFVMLCLVMNANLVNVCLILIKPERGNTA